MSMTGDQLRKISTKLNWYYADLQSRAGLGQFDLHKDAERVFGTVLGIVLGCELEDLNRIRYNHPAVDYGNARARVAVQITATVSDQKIRHTLELFETHRLTEQYDHLIVMVIAPEVGRLAAPEAPPGLTFSKEDIWSIPMLVRKIEALGDEQIAWICSYLDRQIGSNAGPDPLRPDSLIVRRYLNRYIFEKAGALRKMELYQPGRYRVDGQPQIREDISKPISEFLSGSLKPWMEENHIVLQEQAGQAEEKISRDPDRISALLIQGEQCTGKSNLVAQIIHRIDTGALPFRKTYLLSFSERDLRTNSLTCRSICEHLGIRESELYDRALLVIDAMDESGWSQQSANGIVTALIDELADLDCRIIITSRSGYLDIRNEHLITLQLCHLSEDQALSWIRQYGQAFPEKNTKNLEQYVNHLIALKHRAAQAEQERNDRSRGLRVDERFPTPPLTREERNLLHTAEIILMPHVMELCINDQVMITNISSLAQLYVQVFLSGRSGNLLHSRYGISRSMVSSEEETKILTAATAIALQCLRNPEGGISQKELERCVGDESLVSVVCTKYLLTRSADRYFFVHRSIPSFLAARFFYVLFADLLDQPTAEAHTLEKLWEVVRDGEVLSALVQEYIRYFAQQEEKDLAEQIVAILRQILDYRICGTVAAQTGLPQLLAQRRILCDNLVRLYAAFNVLNCDRIRGTEFFEKFSAPQQRQLLALLADPDAHASGSMGFCRLEHGQLEGLNLSGADFHRRYLHHMQMHRARLCETTLKDAYVVECDLSLSCLDRANSKGVQYHNSILCGCSFRNANLNGAIFTNCNLANADIRGARVFKMKVENCILGGMKVDVTQLKDLLYMDFNFIRFHHIRVYLGDELLTGERFLEEYKKVRPIRSLSIPNHFV